MVIRQYTLERITEMKNLLEQDAERRGEVLAQVDIVNPIIEWSDGVNSLKIGSFIVRNNHCNEVISIEDINGEFYVNLHKITNKGARNKSCKSVRIPLTEIESFTNINFFKPGDRVYLSLKGMIGWEILENTVHLGRNNIYIVKEWSSSTPFVSIDNNWNIHHPNHFEKFDEQV